MHDAETRKSWRPLKVVIAGSGDLSASGQVDEQEITISGSGAIKARDLECTESVVRITGSGSATVWVSDRLDVTISGSGSVRYIGSPTVETTVTGSGSTDVTMVPGTPSV